MTSLHLSAPRLAKKLMCDSLSVQLKDQKYVFSQSWSVGLMKQRSSGINLIPLPWNFNSGMEAAWSPLQEGNNCSIADTQSCYTAQNKYTKASGLISVIPVEIPHVTSFSLCSDCLIQIRHVFIVTSQGTNLHWFYFGIRVTYVVLCFEINYKHTLLWINLFSRTEKGSTFFFFSFLLFSSQAAAVIGKPNPRCWASNNETRLSSCLGY